MQAWRRESSALVAAAWRQRHIARAFTDRLPRDARIAMAAALVVQTKKPASCWKPAVRQKRY